MTEDIEALRKEIDKIDEELIKLISSRFELVRKIGELKRERNLPLTDEERENKVRVKWLLLGKKYGLPESFIEAFLPLLFSYAKLLEINSSKKRRIVILGYGGMAKSFASLFKLSSQEVVITGRNLEKARKLADEFNFVTMDVMNAVKWGEFIIGTFPPSALFSDLSLKVYSNIKGKIFMDISSSKKSIFSFIEEKSLKEGFIYVSLHPLFGPYTYPVGEKIVIIPSRSSDDVTIQEIVKFFRDVGLSPIISTLEEHEKAMAIVQVLPHFYLLGLTQSIEKLSKELDVNFENYQTTNFREIYKVIKRISEIKDVILEIQYLNPYAEKAREVGVRELNNLYNEFIAKKK